MSFFDYETQKKWAINIRQWGYTLGVWCLVVCLISGALAFDSLRKSANASRTYTEQNLMPGIDGTVKKVNIILDDVDASVAKLPHTFDRLSDLTDKTNRIASRLEGVAGNIEGMSADLRPRMNAVFDHTNSILANVEPIPGHIDATVSQVSSRLDSILAHLDGQVINNVDDLITKLNQVGEEYRKAGESLRVKVIENPELQLILDQASVTTRNFAMISGSLAGIADKADRKFGQILAPPKGFWGHVKYGLQVVKDIGGVAFIIIKVLNGL